jgi:hypothetical protein
MRFCGERGPVESRDAVQSLAVVKGSDVERSVDEGIGVEDVGPKMEWFEVVGFTVQVGRSCIRQMNKVKHGSKGRWCVGGVELFPTVLVYGIDILV